MQELQTQTVIVAEIANNHDGQLSKALELVTAAHEAGADVVKAQLGIEELTAPGHEQHEMFAKLALSYGDWDKVREHAATLGIDWAASVWSENACAYVAGIETPFVKIGSGDLAHLPGIRQAAETGKALVLSTGMGTEEEISEALDVWNESGGADVTLLACTVAYPHEIADSNLERMAALRDLYPTYRIGWSNHCSDWRVAALAVSLGAEMIEVHFALENLEDGSLGPTTFKSMVKAARNGFSFTGSFVDEAIGGPLLGVLKCEQEWLSVARRGPSGLRE